MGTGQESLLERLTKTVNLKVNPVKYFRRRGLKPQSDKSTKKKSQRNDNFERTPLYLNIAGYISYLFLNCVGIIRGKFPYLLHIISFFQKKNGLGYLVEWIFGLGPIGQCASANNFKKAQKSERDGYAPLYASAESFYARCVFRRLKVRGNHTS